MINKERSVLVQILLTVILIIECRVLFLISRAERLFSMLNMGLEVMRITRLNKLVEVRCDSIHFAWPKPHRLGERYYCYENARLFNTHHSVNSTNYLFPLYL